MKDTEQFKEKKFIILGLGKSGYHAAILLNKLGAEVIVNEIKDMSGTEYLEKLSQANISCVHGHHDTNLIDISFDYMLKSPGIPYENEMVQKAEQMNLPIITDIELAYLLGENDLIGITGTNGKTTVTTLITDILNAESSRNGRAYSAGNIGISVSEIVQKTDKSDDIVMELSSFQLLGVDQFKPHIAVLLNIYSAHLDYHHTRQAYIEAKANIVKNQSAEDFVVYNADQEIVEKIVKNANSKAIPFSREKELTDGIYIKDNHIFAFGEYIIDRDEVLLKGDHNLENVLATIAVAKLKNVGNHAIRKVLTTFSGIKHRLQLVDEFKGRKIYNDSKATNSQSTKFAVEGFKEPIILLAGGLDRQEDLSQLIEPFAQHVKTLIVNGENKDDFISLGKKSKVSKIIETDSMTDAVRKAFEESDEGDVILLSPASASWDQYATFEQRGDDFIKAVNLVKKELIK